MAVDKSGAIADLEQLQAAALRCEEQLRTARAAYEAGLAQLRGGASIQDALAAGDAHGMRAAVTDALADLERERKASRVSLIRADIAEGTAVTSVARTWGVSHQLVSRYVREASKSAEPGASGGGTSCSTGPASQP